MTKKTGSGHNIYILNLIALGRRMHKESQGKILHKGRKEERCSSNTYIFCGQKRQTTSGKQLRADRQRSETRRDSCGSTGGHEDRRSAFHLRLRGGLSPQRGQGQGPSPHRNRPHSHRCNRRALLGALCHPPHIPLSGTCQLWRGPGDLSAPSRGWGWGGRGVDGGVRAERSFPLDPRCDNSSPKGS